MLIHQQLALECNGGGQKNVYFCKNHCIHIVSWVGLIDVQPCAHQISVVLAIFMAKNGHFLPKNAIFGHRQSQQAQMG